MARAVFFWLPRPWNRLRAASRPVAAWPLAAAAVLAASSALAGPRELVDLEAIRALGLGDLGWSELSRERRGGALVLRGSFRGPVFQGFDAGFRIVERELRERASVYIPAYLEPGSLAHPIVWAAHYAGFADQIYPEIAALAAREPVAFIVHGEEEDDWTSLGFSSRDELVGLTVVALSLANACEPSDYRFANFLLALAETNLRALTLVARLLEAEGLVPGPAGVTGVSKEGFATWFVSAVDDRIAAAAPGGWHLEDIASAFDAEEENWGCDASIGGAVEGAVLFGFRNWLRGSPGGQRALDLFSVDRFAGELHPEFLFVYGDVGLHDLHDGIYYTPGAETRFLENFRAKPFRYDRKPDRDVRETERGRDYRLAALLARYLVTRDASAHPKVEEARVEVDGARFRAIATISGGPEAARVFWSHSPDRAFDDPGNAPWVAVELAAEGDGVWASPWIDFPAGERIGWYVEAERAVAWSGLELPQRDASPQRFFGGPPPLVCPGVAVPDCTPFDRGDANADGRLDLSDALTALGYLFFGTPASLACADAADADDDGELAITDGIRTLGYLFLGDPALPRPFGACDLDPTPDSLGCSAHPPCAR